MSHAAPVRVSHVGAGRFSRLAHGPALQRLASGAAPAVRLEGICDLDPTRPERAERFKQDFGYRQRFADVDEMIEATTPDLVVCSVPPRRAGALLRRVLSRGVAVFTEKPPATSARESTELAGLAADAGALAYVAFNRRRMPAVEFAKTWVQTTDTLRRVRACLARVDRREPDFVTTTGVHAIDTLRYLAGEIVEIASATTRPRHGSGCNVVASLRCDSGVTAALDIRVDASMALERYTLDCDASIVDVCICAPYSDASLWAGVRVHRGRDLVREVPADADWLNAAGILDEHRACLRALASRTPIDCSLEDAGRSMAVAEKIAM
jgi:predicted dehydrogenase